MTAMRAGLTGGTLRPLGEVPLDDVRHHADECGVITDGSGADEEEFGGRGRLTGLDVEIVEDLDVVADEADRHDHDRARAASHFRAERVVDVGLEPRLARIAAPT